jgi:hypothetical protein
VYVIASLMSAYFNICSAVDRNFKLSFVLWLLIAEKETTLQENPHFYGDLSEVDSDDFVQQPLLLDTPLAAFAKNPHIYVLGEGKRLMIQYR